MAKKILGVTAPSRDCTDKKCPFHGKVTVKNELFTGTIVSRDSNRSATIEWFRPFYVPKYERYEIRRSRLRVHNPVCIGAGIGQRVLAARTKPLSKMKHHVILKITDEERNESNKK